MKLKNYKKTIILVLVFVLIILSIAICLNTTLSSYKNSYYFDRMIRLIMNDEERKLNKAELESFKNNIISEAEAISEAYLLEKAYYALGAIEYLEGNYDKSIEFLIKSSKCNPENLNNIDLMIYSALSTNYMKIGEFEIAEKYFDQAKDIAIKKKLNNELVNIYYSRAKGILNSNGNLDEAIYLMEESNKLKQSYNQRIRSNLFLSTMYRLKGEEDIALDYDEKSLSIELYHNDDKSINACIINLGENYYVMREYNKVIYIYESLLQSKRVKESNNKLNIYAYLLESYFEVGKEEKVEFYKERYLEELKNIDEEDQNRELIWIYMILSDINIKKSNFEIGELYYNSANELYEKNKEDSYANTDIYLEKLEVGLKYLKNKDFNSAIEGYENLLDKIKKRGISSDIFYSVAYSLVKLSYENKNYEKFANQIVELYKVHENKDGILEADAVLGKLNNQIFKRNKEYDRRKIYFLTFLLSISIGTISLVHVKNKRIRMLNKELRKAIITDGLTKVYNKRYLYKTFESIASKGSDVIFIMIDIDYFKKYNDNYGHLKGDEALINVANIIKNTFKNDMTFRYGGEEFSVISERTKKEVLIDIELLRERIYEENIEHKFSKVSDRITVSIGIESLTINSMYDVELLITSSDKKLYESKVAGRNRYTI